MQVDSERGAAPRQGSRMGLSGHVRRAWVRVQGEWSDKAGGWVEGVGRGASRPRPNPLITVLAQAGHLDDPTLEPGPALGPGPDLGPGPAGVSVTWPAWAGCHVISADPLPGMLSLGGLIAGRRRGGVQCICFIVMLFINDCCAQTVSGPGSVVRAARAPPIVTALFVVRLRVCRVVGRSQGWVCSGLGRAPARRGRSSWPWCKLVQTRRRRAGAGSYKPVVTILGLLCLFGAFLASRGCEQKLRMALWISPGLQPRTRAGPLLKLPRLPLSLSPPSLPLPPSLFHALTPLHRPRVCVCENNCNGGRGSTKLESGSGSSRLEPVRPSWSVHRETDFFDSEGCVGGGGRVEVEETETETLRQAK
jgi:hypothetical protein